MTEMKKLEKEDMQSSDIVKENIEQLKQLFPEIFSEDKINFEKLEEILGNYVNQDEDHYNFTWHGKKKAARLAQTPSTGTLRPAKDESVDFDNTQNLFIEGDNLEVLKLLQKSYHRKVKMIYIDPPYNTGNDFVYEDDFKDGVSNYLKMTGQLDESGKKLGTNSSSAGRYHTNWLNMMYPRLKLARNLLRDDGVIFISIDDNEQANLKKLCDEVFGEENLICNVVRKTKTTSNNGTFFAPSHEYILVYAKSVNECNGFSDREAQESEQYLKLFKHEDEYSKYNTIGLYQPSLKHGGSTYPIQCPDGSFVITPNGLPWRWSEKTFKEHDKNNKVIFKKTNTSPLLDLNGEQAKWNIYTKLYLKDRLESGLRPISFIDKYNNSEATKELKEMSLPFDFSKPKNLIMYIMKLTGIEDGIIVDFFAGSGTTAHAVMQLNSEDGGNRKCISVQLPEKTDEKSEAFKAGYKNIAEISKERIRRAAKKIKQENPDYQGDLGFKVFKLDSSNIKRWDANFDNLKQNLIDAVDYIKQDRSNDDIVYEILLKYGLDLAVPIEIREIAEAKIYVIGFGALVICLDKNINMEAVNGICTLKTELSPEIMRVVFLDNGFRDDVIKTNAIATLKRAGIEDVKSL